MQTQKVGRFGENLAARFLVGKGFKILVRNWHTRYGEVDLVGEKDGAIHFIEVKTRSSLQAGEPEEAINYFKMRRLKLAAQSFLLAYKLGEPCCQFDSVAIILDVSAKKARIRFRENVIFD